MGGIAKEPFDWKLNLVSNPKRNERYHACQFKLSRMTSIRHLLLRHPLLMRSVLKSYGLSRGCAIKFGSDQSILIVRGDTSIRIRDDMAPYVRDIVDDFQSYAEATTNHIQDSIGRKLLDFRDAATHSLRGWELFEVQFPGLPEPIQTIEQYVNLTTMRDGMNIMDLGAYAGISAMYFSEVVGSAGSVLALEPDPKNAACARQNISRYLTLRGYGPTLVEKAIWSHTGSIDFVPEASLGSAVAEVLPRASGGGETLKVPCTTLSELALDFRIEQLHVIKADIEGAEFAAFSDREFFAHHHPRVIFEPALNKLPETQIRTLRNLMESYGYKVSIHQQTGSRLPLLLCT